MVANVCSCEKCLISDRNNMITLLTRLEKPTRNWKKQDVFKKAQTMWKSVKTDQEKYNETIILLKSIAAKQANKSITFWVNARRPSPKKQVIVEEIDTEKSPAAESANSSATGENCEETPTPIESEPSSHKRPGSREYFKIRNTGSVR